MQEKYSADDIQVVTAREAVRLRPSLYVKKILDAGSLNALPLEVACHAIDEFYDNKCTTIEITIFKNRFVLKYDAGLSLSTEHGEVKAVTLMTSLFACRNGKKHLAVGEEFCELGIATVNFCSESFLVNTGWNGQIGIFKFERGIVVEQTIENKASIPEYTEILCVPDAEIFGNLALSFSGMETMVKAVQSKLSGLRFTLQDASHIN